MARREHNYNSGRIHRAGQEKPGRHTKKTPPAEPAAAPYRPAAAKPRKKPSKVLIALLLVLALGVGAFALLFGFLSGFFQTGLLGSIDNYKPKEYSKKDVVNILIVGIDNEEGRDYGAGLGLTDMILYANYDLVNNKLNLLQIPRDSYVGEEVPTGGTGKINAVLISGEDSRNPINNLVGVIENQFELPVDHYIAMDMDALKTIVDTFGGLMVYVPQEMSNEGSYLPQGWQWLDGNAAEFFVRNRKGPGFEQADLARLDNQRHFYSALFRRFMNLTPTDIVKLLPVFEHYCNTDIGMKDIFDLAYSGLNLQPENVMFCKAPGATDPGLDPSGQGRSLYFIDKFGRGTPEDPGVANLLNDYFRSYGQPVPAEQLGLPDIQIPESLPLYSPNVQVMSSVQEGEGGAEVDVEPHFA
ncbi:LCP family protein [Ruminococcaceae bacterium OttesenSCG-928-I18]|nr:LCP family protein [Ruminococcaceae bacterium OttesenSCG-928-I18]